MLTKIDTFVIPILLSKLRRSWPAQGYLAKVAEHDVSVLVVAEYDICIFEPC